MYIIIALIFTTKDHYVKLSFQWSDGGVQFVYWVQTFMMIKRYPVEKIIITKKFQATMDLLCWAALAHRPGKWSPFVLLTWMASRLHTSHRNAICWTPNYSFVNSSLRLLLFFSSEKPKPSVKAGALNTKTSRMVAVACFTFYAIYFVCWWPVNATTRRSCKKTPLLGSTSCNKH